MHSTEQVGRVAWLFVQGQYEFVGSSLLRQTSNCGGGMERSSMIFMYHSVDSVNAPIPFEQQGSLARDPNMMKHPVPNGKLCSLLLLLLLLSILPQNVAGGAVLVRNIQ